MQCVNLTDDELWRAIAQNTNAMSALIDQQLELDATINTPNDIVRRASLVQVNADTINKLQRNYREYTAELRRRYPWGDCINLQSAAEVVSYGTQPRPINADASASEPEIRRYPAQESETEVRAVLEDRGNMFGRRASPWRIAAIISAIVSASISAVKADKLGVKADNRPRSSA